MSRQSVYDSKEANVLDTQTMNSNVMSRFGTQDTLTFLLVLLCLVINVYCMKVIKSEAGSDSDWKSTTMCPGCRTEQDIRTQYHLKQIKLKIQSALGFDPAKENKEDFLEVTGGSTGPSIDSLPSPIVDGDVAVTGESSDERSRTSYNAQRQIILPEQGQNPAREKRYLKFKMSLESLVFGKEISLADLWLSASLWKCCHRLKVRLSRNGMTLDQRTIPPEEHAKLRASIRDSNWVSVPVKDLLKDAITNQSTANARDQYSVMLLVKLSKDRDVIARAGSARCNGTETSTAKSAFLVVETVARSRPRRKRGVDCVAGKQQRCCRGRLTVKFADIGLGSHVIEPREFEAFQCMGTCGSFSSNISPRVDIVKSVLSNLRMKKAKTDHITFCCTAERSGSQKLIYFNNDKTKILAKNFHGLIVESCDCL
eukprot:gene3661-4178_t